MFTKTKLLQTGPTARRFHVPARWLQHEAETGRIPAVKADRALLLDPDTVERVLLERAQTVLTEGATR